MHQQEICNLNKSLQSELEAIEMATCRDQHKKLYKLITLRAPSAMKTVGDLWESKLDNLAGLSILLLVILGELIDSLGELITLGELILFNAKESLAG